MATRSIRGKIAGIPFGHDKVRGDLAGPEEWSRAIRSQTENLPGICGPCMLRVTFLLPPSKFPKDHPFGNDLDNLLKRFCDALQDTVLLQAPGKDGAIVCIEATKARVESDETAGAEFELIEIVPTG
jgi:Holliday junction resolvase RusA-like endonuclease